MCAPRPKWKCFCMIEMGCPCIR
ncbi:DUF3709 domain-containing protein [Paenibacillus oralis]|uniref:DUF3709 domain-containing protein n=1 Tax=Paenibacillus oralis TaxID=2490856 RepID=A0A3P3UBP8_9BACL|nr:DUF3709 domain-containing protein [Paenibacillus oralis]